MEFIAHDSNFKYLDFYVRINFWHAYSVLSLRITSMATAVRWVDVLRKRGETYGPILPLYNISTP